ncbi:MAG: hydroxymethylglutaryl-CoA lyase [Syntrophales bacterium]|nr:hydroxymethylglutaryl-CoA lyase [Syntrophales bacterium]
MTRTRNNEEAVIIVEVSPRDGLPVVCGGASVVEKVNYINLLTQAGIKYVESVAFTHPRLIPETADAEEVMARLDKRHDVTYIGLVPNEIGCRRALISDVDDILTLVAVSDTFNQLSVGRSRRETIHKILPSIFEVTHKHKKNIRSYLMTAFGCPYEGEVAIDEVIQLFLTLSYMGANEIVLVDSTGMANPRQVKELIRRLLALEGRANLGVHFHNTRGAAIANCMAAYEAGVRTFYTSIGGMSGTPYGAMELAFGYWNVPTEDLVHLFEIMGISTGIDLDQLLRCVEKAESIAGKPLPGHILRAGPAWKKTTAPVNLEGIAYRQLQ